MSFVDPLTLFLTQAAADARYFAAASGFGASVSAVGPGAVSTAGVAASASRSDHVHAYQAPSNLGTTPLELWYPGSPAGQLISSGNLGVTTIHAVPWIAPRTGVLDRIGFQVDAAAAGTYRLGMYGVTSQNNLYPNALLLDTGANAVAIGPLKQTISFAVVAGTLYFLVLQLSSATVQMTTFTSTCNSVFGLQSDLKSSALSIQGNQAVGAFPATFPGTFLYSGVAPAIAVRYVS